MNYSIELLEEKREYLLEKLTNIKNGSIDYMGIEHVRLKIGNISCNIIDLSKSILILKIYGGNYDE